MIYGLIMLVGGGGESRSKIQSALNLHNRELTFTFIAFTIEASGSVDTFSIGITLTWITFVII